MMEVMKKAKLSLVNDYFGCEDLINFLSLDDEGLLSYHWANDPIALKRYKSDFKSDKNFMNRFNDLNLMCLELEKVPIWLSSRRGRVASTLRHLYESYLDPRMRDAWHTMDDIMVSFQDSLGPYQSIKSMKWYKEDIYSAFVFRKIFETWIPERKFRLGTNITLDIHKERNPYIKKYATIHQVSQDGLLIKFLAKDHSFLSIRTGDGDFCLNKLTKLDHKKKCGKDSLNSYAWLDSLKDFTLDERFINQALAKSNIAQGDFSYLFVPYSQMRAKNFSKKSILDLLNGAQELIHKKAG
jgi:hypothetical protein